MDYIIVKKDERYYPYYCGGFKWTADIDNADILILRTYDEALLRCIRLNQERKWNKGTPVRVVSKKAQVRKLKLKKIYENRINS